MLRLSHDDDDDDDDVASALREDCGWLRLVSLPAAVGGFEAPPRPPPPLVACAYRVSPVDVAVAAWVHWRRALALRLWLYGSRAKIWLYGSWLLALRLWLYGSRAGAVEPDLGSRAVEPGA